MILKLAFLFLSFLHAISCDSLPVSHYQKRLDLVERLKYLHAHQANQQTYSLTRKFQDNQDWADIENACLTNYDNLAWANADFFRCVLTNSRPFRICGSCKSNYTRVIEARYTVQKDTHVYAQTLFPDGLSCEDIIEATDRVQLAVKIADSIDKIWSDSKCTGISDVRL